MNYATDLEWHRSLVALFASRMRPSCYLELGCENTPAVLQLHQFCGVTHGVDIQRGDFAMPPNFTLHLMTTDAFFEHVTIPPPELVLIDACHQKDQVLRDFEGVKRIAAPNCVVVIHDTFPEDTGYISSSLCFDSYLVPSLLSVGNVTLPCPPGVTLAVLNSQYLVPIREVL